MGVRSGGDGVTARSSARSALDVASQALGGAPLALDGLPERNDPLAEALQHLRMDGMFYCHSELTAPWGLDLPPMPDCLWFHVVMDGTCVITTSTGTSVQLATGDLLVLPHGAGHSAADHPTSPTPLVFDLPHEYISRQYAVLRHGDGGAPCSIICGVVHLGHPAARLLMTVLPELMHIDAATGRRQWEWLPSILTLMTAEAQTTRPGGETVITRLSDILVIQAIRAWIETSPEAQTGWLQALRHPQIGQAISLIHRDPASDWTVARLANEVGMSRSNLSARFTELVGMSPKHYITRWRIRLAEDLLTNPDLSLAQIAVEVGYQSEAAFSRAFKRETGAAPSQARHRPEVADIARQYS